MPIFEYRCGKCEKYFEELVLSNGQKIECPSCGSRKVEKQISAFSNLSGNVGGQSTGGCSHSGGGG